MNNRPVGVTIVAIIAWLSGFVQIVGSIFAIIGGLFVTWPAILGWIALVIGVVTLAVGVGLWRGSTAARVIATIVFVLNVAFAILSLFGGESLWSAIGSGGLSAIGLAMLYTQAANRYFAR